MKVFLLCVSLYSILFPVPYERILWHQNWQVNLGEPLHLHCPNLVRYLVLNEIRLGKGNELCSFFVEQNFCYLLSKNATSFGNEVMPIGGLYLVCFYKHLLLSADPSQPLAA